MEKKVLVAKQHIFHGWEPRSVYDLIGDIVLRANPPRPIRIVFPRANPPRPTLLLLLFVVCCLLFVVPSDGVFPRAFRVSFPTVNKGFRAIFDDLRAGLEQWAYVAFTGTLS